MDQLRGKTLVMCVGPSAIGKSTLMNEVVKRDSRFSRVRTFTTRAARPNDEPGHYIYLTPEELNAKRASGEVVSEVVFPTTGQVYGTLTSSYQGDYCLLDTLANSVDLYRSLPFNHTVTVTVVADPKEWKRWFATRYPEPSKEAERRLEEARLSINWSLGDPETYWLINSEGKEQDAAQKLIDIVTSNQERGSTPDEPRAMLELPEKGMWT